MDLGTFILIVPFGTIGLLVFAWFAPRWIRRFLMWWDQRPYDRKFGEIINEDEELFELWERTDDELAELEEEKGSDAESEW